MKCELEERIDHSSIQRQFRETLIPCPIFERQDIGMHSLGVICGGCCLKLQMVAEAAADLLLRSVVNAEDYNRSPDIITEHLPEHLREHYHAIGRLGKTIKDAAAECGRCKPKPIEDQPVKAVGKTEMTQCGKNDLR